ncbi:MAG: NUDIX domain-containing protein [Oligoflexia bacterium]|nr:NUDIX domain-containing protein [Oligoflexia bacterium]
MNKYNKPNLTVDAVVLCGSGEETKLLVVERKNNPFKGKLAFPGGFINQYETPYRAVLRELFEETSLNLEWKNNKASSVYANAIALKVRGREGRDPRGWTVSIPYLFHLTDVSTKQLKVKAADDAKKAFWIKLTDLNELAFDHGAILCESLGYLWNWNWNSNSNSNKKELIFFGGTFSPWHQGHTSVIMSLPPRKRERVVVVPDKNPLKEPYKEMLNLDFVDDHFCAFKYYRYIKSQVSEEKIGVNLQVYPGFCGQEDSNPTSSWLPYINSQNNTKYSLSLLIGDDSFIDLKKWINPKAFLTKIKKIYVVPRLDDSKAIKKSMCWIKSINKNIVVQFMDHHQYQHISSTMIRDSIRDSIDGIST